MNKLNNIDPIDWIEFNESEQDIINSKQSCKTDKTNDESQVDES